MFDELVLPISDEAPCGEYLKDNRSVYRGYRNAFNIAQSSFRRLVEDPDALNNSELVEANADNWKTLSDECDDCLKTISKDVEILCWHAVAQIFSKDPLGNLLSSLQVFQYLVINFWSTLNPMPAEEKLQADTDEGKQKEWAEGRIKPLAQLVGDTAESGLLYMPLQMLELISGIDYGKFFAAEKSGKIVELKSQALSALVSERGAVTERILALGSIHETLLSIEQKIGEYCLSVGTRGISFRFVKDSVDRLLKALRYLVGEGFPHWPLDPKEEVTALEETVADISVEGGSNTDIGAVSSGSQVKGTTMASAGIVASRDQALRELQKIADYFIEAEPHSPIYMLLKRAIRWGHMSLPELLEELIGDNSAVQARITQLAGLESAEHKAQFSKAVFSSESVAVPVPVKKEVEKKESTPKMPDSTSSLTGIEW